MKSLKFFSAIALSFGLSVAAEDTGTSLSSVCDAALNSVKASLPANATSAKISLAEAMGVSKALKSAEEDDATSEKTLQLSAACSLYVNIVKVQGETQAIRNHIDENWAKRAATARDIESIRHQIHTGKVSDLKDHEAKLQAEMLQNQEKFAAEAAANEAALKAAGEREADLQKALAEERAKAEQRQKDAMNKLNELQSKLIQVSKDARGIILSMSDILFDVNQATLKADLKTSLAKVAGILSVYQQFNVSIEGNTDNTGSEEFNMKLSQQRADNVMNFLVEQGIDANRLTAKGLGMTMPIADNSTKEGRQKNRRVDLVIQDKALQGKAEGAKE